MRYSASIASIIVLVGTSAASAEKTSPVEVVNSAPIPVAVVNEPVRSPYQAEVDFTAGSCISPAFCIIEFPVVPEGKRLVVEEVTILAGVAGGAPNFVVFGDDFTTNTGNRFIVKADFSAGPSILGTTFYSMNRPVHVYYEPGETPKLKVGASANFSFVNNATLHGYLTDAAN